MRIRQTPRRTICFFQTLGGEFGIFVIDNAHFIDPASWTVMWPVLQSVTLFMVMSLAPGHERTESFFKAAADSTTSQRISCLHLEELKPAAVVQKVCQDLGVVSIPRDLARYVAGHGALPEGLDLCCHGRKSPRRKGSTGPSGSILDSSKDLGFSLRTTTAGVS